MKTGSVTCQCRQGGSLCVRCREAALRDNFEDIQTMARPANMRETTMQSPVFLALMEQIDRFAWPNSDMTLPQMERIVAEALRTVEREALERAAKLLDERCEKVWGETEATYWELSRLADAIRKMALNGDSES